MRDDVEPYDLPPLADDHDEQEFGRRLAARILGLED